jgi:hypothetical protein
MLTIYHCYHDGLDHYWFMADGLRLDLLPHVAAKLVEAKRATLVSTNWRWWGRVIYQAGIARHG